MSDVVINDGDFIVTSSGESEDAVRAALADPVQDAAPVAETEPADTADAEAEPAAEPKTDDKPKKRSAEARKQSIQAEIDDLTAKRHEARRAIEAESAELARMRQALDDARAQQAHAKATVQQNGGDAEPTLDQFDTYDAYVKAQARWEARQILQQEREADMQRQQAALQSREQQQHVTRYAQQLQEASADDPEFATKVRPELLDLKPYSLLTPEERQTATVYNAIAEEILRSENAPGLLRYLSENFDTEFQRLATLQTPDQLRWSMARLHGRLDAVSSIGPAATPRPLSSAKPPIKPMGSAPSAGDDAELSDDLPIEEWIRRSNHRDRVARAGR